MAGVWPSQVVFTRFITARQKRRHLLVRYGGRSGTRLAIILWPSNLAHRCHRGSPPSFRGSRQPRAASDRQPRHSSLARTVSTLRDPGCRYPAAGFLLAKEEAPELVNRGFLYCRRSMCGGDDPHAENHISTFAAVACLARHCAMQKTRIQKKPRGGTNRPGLSRVNEISSSGFKLAADVSHNATWG